MTSVIKEINDKLNRDIEINWKDHCEIYNKLTNKLNGYKAQFNEIQKEFDR